jgi:hypothetical protein
MSECTAEQLRIDPALGLAPLAVRVPYGQGAFAIQRILCLGRRAAPPGWHIDGWIMSKAHNTEYASIIMIPGYWLNPAMRRFLRRHPRL